MLDDSLVRNGCPFATNGIEDIRLFRWRNSIYGLGAGLASADNIHFCTRQLLMRIEGNTVVEYSLLQSPINAPIEKNWTPVVVGEDLFIIYTLSPFAVYKFEDSELKLVKGEPPSTNTVGIRGGTRFVRMGEKYIGLSHLPPTRCMGKTYYRHVFVLLDIGMNVEDISEPFFIQRRGIEFAAGLEMHDNGLLLSYGVSDRAAACVIVPRSELHKWVVV
jgi:hypothetical protein